MFNSYISALLPIVNVTRCCTCILIITLIFEAQEGCLAYHFAQALPYVFHKSKVGFIFDVLDKTGNMAPQPTVSVNRIKLAERKAKPSYYLYNFLSHELEEHIEGSVKDTLFYTAFKQLTKVHPGVLRRKKPGAGEPHFCIKVVFKGENVEGEGGPYRQFFTEVAQELQGSLFLPCPNAQMKVIAYF